jgi:UDP-N-acetylmuramyl pentapeptide phosphotransferase/UDP-N-acetylglucosamine-1-phosphate transferase
VSGSYKNSANSPSKQTLTKYIAMALLALLSFGLTGLGAIVVMFALSTLRAGRDSAASHGISSRNSSRLGGVAIVITFILFLIGMVLLSSYTPGVVRDVTFLHVWSTVFVCVILGGAEDIKADLLSPYFRLVVKLLVFGFFLWTTPNVVPLVIGIPGIDYLLSDPLVAWGLCTVFCVGFINAFNMADGANGLIPGIATIAFGILFLVYGRPAEGVLFFVCLMFLIFNVVSGWFFLGDMGSYGLGAALVCYGLLGVAQGDFSAGFMASLLSYPCVDFLVSVIRRLRKGLSPLQADNGHLHNRLYNFYVPKFKSRVTPNSLTGLTISSGSSGVSLLIYVFDWIAIDSNAWFGIFGIQVVVYLITLSRLRRMQMNQSEGAIEISS